MLKVSLIRKVTEKHGCHKCKQPSQAWRVGSLLALRVGGGGVGTVGQEHAGEKNRGQPASNIELLYEVGYPRTNR